MAAMNIPLMNNAKIVRCDLPAGQVWSMNRAYVKLFINSLVQTWIDLLPDLFDHASLQCFYPVPLGLIWQDFLLAEVVALVKCER